TFFGINVALAVLNDNVQHGIGFTKGCDSPTAIGQPYSCSFTVRNVVDEANDTLTISNLIDTVQSSAGDVVSTNIVLNGQLTTTTTPTGPTQSGSPCFGFIRGGSDLSATQGSTTVTSATAAFSSPADVGRKLLIQGIPYTIASVTNATTAVL